MEKVKFGTTEFELIPNGVDDTQEDQLTLRFQLGERTVNEVEALLSDTENTKRIEILETDGSLQRPFTGYSYLKKISKIKDYLVEIKTSAPAEGEGETEQTEVRVDIAESILAKADLRAQLDELAKVVNVMLGVE